jgi:hypothetical protein
MSRFPASGLLSLCACILLPAALAAQGPSRVGSEFRVNSYTSGEQSYPAVAMDGGGGFVVVWLAVGRDGSGNGIFAQRYSSAGAAQAVEFQVNSYTSDAQSRPAIGMAPDGRFVVAWQSNLQDGGSYGVFGRRFDAAGVPQAAELQLNAFFTGVQASPTVALDAAGDFVVAWDSNGQDGSSYGVFGRRFNASGVAQASEFEVNLTTAGAQQRPKAAMDGNGDFVIAWQAVDGAGTGIFARRFDAAGNGLGGELQVDLYSATGEAFPAIGMNATGEFVIAWRSITEDGNGGGVFARRFDAAGVPQPVEIQVNAYTTGNQVQPAVRVDGNGAFVVVWRSDAQDGSGYGVFGRRFDPEGLPQASEFEANTYTLGSQSLPALAMEPNGNFVVAWQSYAQDGSMNGIFAQRFMHPAVLDIDGNGTTGALTDGLLVLRYLFGFTGATLVAGSVDVVGCTRCSAPAIENYLSTLL